MHRNAVGVRARRFLKRAPGRYSRRGNDDGMQGNEGGTMQETTETAQGAPARGTRAHAIAMRRYRAAAAAAAHGPATLRAAQR